jgi:hypothetical protein
VKNLCQSINLILVTTVNTSINLFLKKNYVSAVQINSFILGIRANELLLLMLLRLKGASGDVEQLYEELLELCGDGCVDIVFKIISNKEALLAEFKVCIYTF